MQRALLLQASLHSLHTSSHLVTYLVLHIVFLFFGDCRGAQMALRATSARALLWSLPASGRGVCFGLHAYAAICCMLGRMGSALARSQECSRSRGV